MWKNIPAYRCRWYHSKVFSESRTYSFLCSRRSKITCFFPYDPDRQDTGCRSYPLILQFKHIVNRKILLTGIPQYSLLIFFMEPLSSSFSNPVAKYPDHYSRIIIIFKFIKLCFINICLSLQKLRSNRSVLHPEVQYNRRERRLGTFFFLWLLVS